jgi:hypothetical protein
MYRAPTVICDARARSRLPSIFGNLKEYSRSTAEWPLVDA